MSHAWQQTINLTADQAKALIESEHHFAVESITLLDEGWDNLVYLVNQELVFRFPRRELGVMCMENEINLLPFISSQISFPISEPIWIAQRTESYPYPFAGYRLLPGKPLCEATANLINNHTFAKTLASWLKALHSIPVQNQHVSSIKGDQSWRLDVIPRLARCNENVTRYQAFFEQAGFNTDKIKIIIKSLHKFELHSENQCYLHGDLYSRHIIIDKHLSPVGLIDWGDIHIGPPGIDLAVGIIFTEEVMAIFLENYGHITQSQFQILLFNAFCHSISFLPYAYEQNRPSLKRWAQLELTRAIDQLEKR